MSLTIPSATGESVPMKSFPASALKASASEVLETVLLRGGVVITRHDKEKAVILSVDAYRRLVESRPDELDALRARFGGLLAKMQTEKARKGVRDAFQASPIEMGKLATKAARRRG